MNHFIEINGSKLTYAVAGSGKVPLLMFHGFGQTHHAFHTLVPDLLEEHTLYLFDLFFHGDSYWKLGEVPLEKEMWKKFISQVLHSHSIDVFKVLGFSMGGKFALATLEAFPTRTKEIILLAPDGIKTNFWYSLATYPLMLRNIFKSLIHHPRRFQAIAHLAFNIRLIDRGILRFVEYQMNTEEKRSRVYHSWVVFRHIQFSLRTIGELINHHEIALIILVGKHDKIITAPNMQHLLRHVKKARLVVVNAGHNDLIDRSREYLKGISS